MSLILDGTAGVTHVGGTTQKLSLTAGTSVASTSGTAIDFTGIPANVERITVMFSGVSTSGTANFWVQLGTSAGVDTTANYVSGCANASTTVTTATATGAFLVDGSVAATNSDYGAVVITNITGNTWVLSGQLNNAGVAKLSNGAKTLSGTLDRVRITTANGTDTFDAGTINIMYE